VVCNCLSKQALYRKLLFSCVYRYGYCCRYGNPYTCDSYPMSFCRFCGKVVSGVLSTFLRCSGRNFAGCQHASHDGSVEFVLPFRNRTRVVLYAQNEDRKHSFLVEAFLRERDRKNPVESVLAVGGFITMLSRVPGKDSSLVVIVRRTVVRFGEQTEILRNFLVAILNGIKNEESDKALTFGVLRNVEPSPATSLPARGRMVASLPASQRRAWRRAVQQFAFRPLPA
jgi:hypothetical protein